MTRTIVTGGAGRLGRSVVAQLTADGFDVVSVDRESSTLLDVDQVSVDLTDLEAAVRVFRDVRPEAVVHLAAIAVPFSAPEERILTTNVSLAYNALRAGLDAGATRFAVASSPTVLGYGAPGWLPTRFPLDEEEPARPWNAYALSKYSAENIMRMFAVSDGGHARFGAFRPCYVIAPEEWDGALTQQGHTVEQRLNDPALAAPALFNYVDARDAGDFVATLVDQINDIPQGETFFVGAADALARAPLAELLPEFLPGSSALASSLTGRAPAFSISKAQALLGWSPKRSWRTELTPAAKEFA